MHRTCARKLCPRTFCCWSTAFSPHPARSADLPHAPCLALAPCIPESNSRLDLTDASFLEARSPWCLIRLGAISKSDFEEGTPEFQVRLEMRGKRVRRGPGCHTVALRRTGQPEVQSKKARASFFLLIDYLHRAQK